ncbi:MAG: type II toxin-antitoxin system RelE family toxin [Elusimicrobiota bacterium]
MTFQVLYHPHISRDIKRISHEMHSRIETMLSTKLLIAPEIYGKPLSGSLGGYWKLRVGNYRIVFKIVKNEIWILAIVHRKSVYGDVIKRLLWSPIHS